MDSRTKHWDALCLEHASAMMQWRELFAKNCAELSASYRGHAAQPSLDTLSAQSRAWERVIEVDEC